MYRCDRGIGGCGQVSRQRKLVDQYVAERVLRGRAHLDQSTPQKNLLDDLAALSSSEREIELRIEELDDAFEGGDLEIREYCRMTRRLRLKLDDLHKQIGAARLHSETANRADAAEVCWDSWTVEEQRAFIRSQLKDVIIKPVGRCGRRPKGFTLPDDEIELVPHQLWPTSSMRPAGGSSSRTPTAR